MASSLTLILISLLFISTVTTSPFPSHNQTHHLQLYQCLHSIIPSTLLHFPINTTYTPTLNSHIRNLRFLHNTTPKPLLIITPLHPSHIQSTIKCSRPFSILIKIRSGGHDYEGLSYTTRTITPPPPPQPFILLDMSNLRSITFHLNSAATVQSGATIGELFHAIGTYSRTIAFPAGICPTVGVGGHFSAGGYGPLIRKYGLTADNIVDAELVDAEGRLLHRKSMGEDLFWAIRGGGAASFGVVVSYTIKLVAVPENVTVFRIHRTNDDDDNNHHSALESVVEWLHTAYKMVDDLFIRLTMDVVKSTFINNGKKTVRATFRALYLGESRNLLSIMHSTLPSMGVKLTDLHEMSWVDSILFWYDFPLDTPLTALLNRESSSQVYLKRKSDYITHLMDRDAVESIMEKLVELTDDSTSTTHGPYLAFNPYGGRMWEVAETELPFPHREGCLYKVQYVMDWKVGSDDEEDKCLGKIRELYGYMTQFVSSGPRLAFFNYRDIDLGVNGDGKWSYYDGRRFGVKYFGRNFDRLVEVKTRVDPHNFFRNEQSIPVLPPLLGRGCEV